MPESVGGSTERGAESGNWRMESHDRRLPREKEERITSLALSYRSGDRAALAALHAELEPLVGSFLRRHLASRHPLPLAVESDDLRQQAVVALAEAALEWRPDLNDSFVPYFLRSFPWRIDRYLRGQTPWRRTARFQVYSVPHDVLMERAASQAGHDGREWDGDLACAELLRGLPGPYRRIVWLHLYRGLPFAEVGEEVGLSRSAAHEAFGRALALMRSALAEPAPPDLNVGRAGSPAGDPNGADAAALRRCVETLHRLAPDGAPLPGCRVLRRVADLTPTEHREIMARLRDTGCVVGRRPGTLACAAPADTLRLLGL